jgi:adenylosuccinate lyase
MERLFSISPIDGRYFDKTEELASYFSEYALMRYRLQVEVDYFIFLAEKKFFKLTKPEILLLEELKHSFSADSAVAIKLIEKTTRHDVKAVEYYLKEKLKDSSLAQKLEWVHFGLTSQDVNNTAIPMMWRDALEELWDKTPMLARTHGQPASPTRLGKEILVFTDRLQHQLDLLLLIPHTGKFGGATGNFNAHHVAYPKYNWRKFADELLEKKCKLIRQQHTTQIEHYDSLVAQFDAMRRINTILIDFCRDMWTYISMDYFTQQVNPDETGSSAMPHKVNPIDFENAEGNLGIANALFEFLSQKLPVSRLQRDLTDSTVIRNIGVPFAHSMIALQSLQSGLQKIHLHPKRLHEDLENNWAVVAEGIQTILRREHYPRAYEVLKELTRGKKIDQKKITAFISKLNVSAAVKKELLSITPHTYTGI